MLKNYTPRPNTMGDMGYGMTMNGTPAVFGAGMDSNNLLDVRDATERNNQGTIRVGPYVRQPRHAQCPFLVDQRAGIHSAEPARLRLQLR